ALPISHRNTPLTMRRDADTHTHTHCYDPTREPHHKLETDHRVKYSKKCLALLWRYLEQDRSGLVGQSLPSNPFSVIQSILEREWTWANRGASPHSRELGLNLCDVTLPSYADAISSCTLFITLPKLHSAEDT